MTGRVRRGRLALRIVLASALALAVAAIAVQRWADHRLAEARASAADSSWPLDLDAYLPDLRPGEDNASDLLTAMGHLRLLDDGAGAPDLQLEPLAGDVGLPPEVLERVRHALESPPNRRLLDLFDDLGSIEHARYLPQPVASAAVAARLEDYARLRLAALTTARLLAVRSRVATAEGRNAAAWSDAAAALRVASWLHEEMPGVAPWLLGTAAAHRGLDAVEAATLAAAPGEPERRTVLTRLDRLALEPGRWIGGERALNHHLTQALLPRRRTGWRDLLMGWTEDLHLAGSLKTFAALGAWASLPPYARPPVEEALGGAASSPSGAALLPNLLDAVARGDRLALRVELARAALRPEPAARPLPDPFSGGEIVRSSDHGLCRWQSAEPAAGGGPVTWTAPCGD